MSNISRQNYRFRQSLLNTVNKYWIQGVLEKSIETEIVLEFEERCDTVSSSFRFSEVEKDTQTIEVSKGTSITNIFDQLGSSKSLLILGSPGSGKTISLLQLAKNLINRANENVDSPIPIILNLSSWQSNQAIVEWLVRELNVKYFVSRKLSQDWINNNNLLLLLDGLDEVSARYRDACVLALNEFLLNHNTAIVVCSRTEAYEPLSNRLQFQRAIELKSLASKQIQTYLDELSQLNNNLVWFKASLERNTDLQELVKSPLMLSILVSFLQNASKEELANLETTPINQKLLLGSLFERLIQVHISRIGSQYRKEQMVQWLGWVAQNLEKNHQTIFLLERLQPSLLKTQRDKQNYRIITRLCGGLLGGVIFAIIGSIVGGNIGLIVCCFVGVLIGASISGLIEKDSIQIFEVLTWSWQNALIGIKLGLFGGLRFGIIGILIGGIVGSVIGELKSSLLFGLVGALGCALASGLFGGLILGVSSKAGIEIGKRTNQGIWFSLRNALFVGGLTGFFLSLFFLCLFSFLYDWNTGLLLGISAGILSGWFLGMYFGGRSVIQHYTLRLYQSYKGYFPTNYTKFLDYAVECSILQRVGGGYIFIHRSALEYFSSIADEG